MTEKKPLHAEDPGEVGGTGAEGHGTRTVEIGAGGETPKPKIEGIHATESVDPAEDPGIQNSVA
ncbi:hypothetical protein [Methylobacterium iners]|uniref:Uncharacterized protein n=1 Tax=Methylobacterium iners TaxID=418707 RepID=A0ABQ4S582_9HYPH|nr:hypothetical protein [Methylobacterium iners]GJD96912.1 hypothetical protein OCOJLMKI_4139 [Methylobacterium iners]